MKSMFKGPYRSKTFDEPTGAYVLVYQRPDEPPRLDVNFFDGDQPIGNVERLYRLLDNAIAKAKKWEAE